MDDAPEAPTPLAPLVERRVHSGERAGAPTRTTVTSRVYATDQRDLWDAITSIDRIPRWFLPITGTLELGGRYQLDGNAGGSIVACDEPHSFEITWELGGGRSWVSVVLGPVAGGTRLEVSHEAPVDPTFWARYGPGATGLGWDLAVVGLGRHVEHGETFGPEQETAFAASATGATFLEAAGAAWADAAVADGDEPAAARDAANRSIAFYLPAPQDPAG